MSLRPAEDLGLSTSAVFISYRREDAAPYARLLQMQLRERIPDARVFMDLDSVEPGLDFAEVIREAVHSCQALVALIGRQWLTLTDEEGHRRLDDPDDYVTFEIQTALERGARVIPVLVDGAAPPRQQQLPSRIQKLARLNALELSYGRYDYDAGRLVDLIQRVLGSATGTTRSAVVTADIEAFTAHDVAASPDRAAQLMADAERIAQSITSTASQGRALNDLAWAIGATDPDHAERIANSISDESSKNSALVGVAGAVAATDPDRAERIANAISDESSKEHAFAIVARKVAATDPDRALRIAHAINQESDTAVDALLDIAKVIDHADPDRAALLLADAERVARYLPSEPDQVDALTKIARALAATSPDRAAHLITDAERIAQSITSTASQGRALNDLAWAIGATDPDHAERIARSISDESSRDGALVGVAGALAATDPDRAERITRSITSENSKDRGFAMVARIVAATDPDRALRIAHAINHKSATAVNALIDIAKVINRADPNRAALLLADAERVARHLPSEPDQVDALATVARALAATSPHRAAQLMTDAERE